jgi:hypothetical protein
VHQLRRAHDFSSECFGDTLMTETNSQDCQGRAEMPDDFGADAGLLIDDLTAELTA